ncbi:hypothetical protein A15D_02344 [Alcanivorax sp. MD8A]|uniref:YnfA family protein n=1 Tax=Alcanivorax sp. MD8A TaxID=1177157 RepID=UPI000C99AA69|nr:YnfA family protein [Alcanivorax sp. MD8A]PNE02132.1 hypothetical protein A15D_02344 [Alcanivorax sp. MD8A]
MSSAFWFPIAAVLEIAGCFTFWMWLRQGQSLWWVLPGLVALAGFAWVLTQVESDFAGRAYAAYGGVYIVASLLWGMLVEKQPPSWADMAGVVLCLAGATVLYFSPAFGRSL